MKFVQYYVILLSLCISHNSNIQHWRLRIIFYFIMSFATYLQFFVYFGNKYLGTNIFWKQIFLQKILFILYVLFVVLLYQIINEMKPYNIYTIFSVTIEPFLSFNPHWTIFNLKLNVNFQTSVMVVFSTLIFLPFRFL